MILFRTPGSFIFVTSREGAFLRPGMSLGQGTNDTNFFFEKQLNVKNKSLIHYEPPFRRYPGGAVVF